MKYIPHITLQDAGASLKTVMVDNTDLVQEKRFTFLSADVVSGGSTIAVQSIVGFENLDTSSGQILLIGNLGEELCERVRTSNTTGQSPSAAYKWVYLRDSLQNDHPQDTKVTIIDWDRIEYGYSTTATGSKTTITAYPLYITPDRLETSLRDTTEPTNRLGQATVFYFARFNNTIDSRVSDWSDALYGTGYDANMVGAIKERALRDLNEEVDGKVITHELLNEALWEARRKYHKAPGKRPFRRKYNTDIGNVLTGSFRIVAPTDLEKPYGAENVYGVRVGDGANMRYQDKKEWDFEWRGVSRSTSELAYIANTSTSIWLANGRDFSGSTVLSIEGQNIGVTPYEGSLSGDSLYNSLRIYSHPSNAYNTSAGSDAYENASLGLPDRFTVFADIDGSAWIAFNRPFETLYANQNIYADYYATLVGRDSDGDALDEPDYDGYVHYLKAKIKEAKSKGEMDITKDSDFQQWIAWLQNAIDTERLSADVRLEPDIAHLNFPE